ncbi:salicylate hydroxylase [Mesorhizobium sp. Root157]|uniref:FAD-dependent monooxygenase n=1 Tax=Mesorhizobium sp. Root157 TaxID=1736477 RepID=UPI0006F29954|nr:FAD-dependent monooxygenase [Mesorhizobium sp. Root157]KQZ99656.1 salicylate hydroxylase [Mesorhizobium sp. Root157]
MDDVRSRPIVIAGAGIAGLTAAIAFAERGFAVQVYEQAPQIEAFGAGLQLSPNATHILRQFDVLPGLLATAVQPRAVELKDAATLRKLATVPLGETAERRWNAPYLVVHRADLQSALLATTSRNDRIQLNTGARITGVKRRTDGIVASVDMNGQNLSVGTAMLIGADGVWSVVRKSVRTTDGSRFTGELAWRTTIALEDHAGKLFSAVGRSDCVTTFLHDRFHLVAYPVSKGARINLVAFTKGEQIAESWSGNADLATLKRAMRSTSRGLVDLVDASGPWTAWPLHSVDPHGAWTAPNIALIGDAAHAMTPFAAQGAAMAIEDAALLVEFVAAGDNPTASLAQWEQQRKVRVSKVVRRGALNHLAWHAAGPVALARNLFLKLRSPESLATDLDWLYGWKLPSTKSTRLG